MGKIFAKVVLKVCVVFTMSLVLFSPNFVSSATSKDINTSIPLSRAERIQKALNHPKTDKLEKSAEAFSKEDGNIRVIVKTRQISPQNYRNLKSLNERKLLKNNVKKDIDLVTGRFNQSKKVKVKNKFSYQHAFSAEISLDGLEELIADEDILEVYEDKKRKPMLNQGISLVQGRPARQLYGGEGVSIAILDTGIDYNHPMLGGGGFPNLKVIGGYDTGEDDSDPMDTVGHGTAVAGIAAGDIPDSPVGDYIGGVSPSSKLYALKIVAVDGYAYDSDIIEAVEWCITHQYDEPSNPIKIINISFGGGEFFGDCDNFDAYMQFGALSVSDANQVGITLFSSSGNEGYTTAMGAPACYSGVISVGEVYDTDIGVSGPWATASSSCTDNLTYSDLVTCYSNSSSTLDLLASGSDAYAPDVLGTAGMDNGDYFPYFGGTSAASPYAAGSAALIQSAAISYRGEYFTPSELEEIMTTNGDLTVDPRNSIVTPRVNIHKAFQSIIAVGDINTDTLVNVKDSILGLQLLSGQNTPELVSIIGEFGNNNRIGMEEVLYSLQVDAETCMSFQPEFCTTLNSCEDAGGDWLNDECHFVDQVECESIQGYWYNNRCNELICDASRLDLCPTFSDCSIAQGFWYDEACNPYICSNDRLDLCPTESDCEVAEGFWYDETCNLHTCNNNRLDLCLSQSECEIAQGFWYNNTCNLEPTCDSAHVEACDGQAACEYVGGYWHNDSCIQDPTTETEPNGSDISADPIVFDTPVTGIIMTSTDDDWFVISNDTARTITVSLAGSESIYGYWKAGVYDSGNTLLAQMSDMGSNDSFNVSLPAAGNYSIVISDDSSAAYQYQYQVTVLSNDGQQVTGTETEPNGSDISADPIVFYTPVTGIIMTSTDDDWFVISNDTARTITVSLAGSESVYGYWKAGVYDSGNTLLAQMSDMGSNDSFNVSLPAAGNYYIVISDDFSAAYQYQYTR